MTLTLPAFVLSLLSTLLSLVSPLRVPTYAHAPASCKSEGCDVPYQPGLPCQCNSDCCSYGNCCSDFKSLCGACRPGPAPSPSPSPWPPWPPSPPPPASCALLCTGTASCMWSSAAAGNPTIEITQNGCAVDCADSSNRWTTAVGSFRGTWDLSMTVVYATLPNSTTPATEVWVGHVAGCSYQTCPAGSSTITWTKPAGKGTVVWSKGPATATQPPNLCIDSSAADNESPIGLSACAADNVVSADQLFTFTQGRYIVLNPAATSAQKCLSKAGSFKKCCIENWHGPGETGDCTVFGCNSEQSTKLWTYDNATGTIANSGQCMTERGGKVVMSSNKSDCAQFD
eukprot:gene19222-31135_t